MISEGAVRGGNGIPMSGLVPRASRGWPEAAGERLGSLTEVVWGEMLPSVGKSLPLALRWGHSLRGSAGSRCLLILLQVLHLCRNDRIIELHKAGHSAYLRLVWPGTAKATRYHRTRPWERWDVTGSARSKPGGLFEMTLGCILG